MVRAVLHPLESSRRGAPRATGSGRSIPRSSSSRRDANDVLFPTFRFAVFFALVLPASWLLMPRLPRWKVFIVLASFVFYGSWNTGYVFLLAASILTNQFLAVLIDATTESRAANRWTAVAVAANLGALAWYKYTGFLADSGTTVLGWAGIDWQLPAPDVLLPIGISFFTFQALSYVIDVRRGLLRPVPFLDFAVYLSFFPHLVAGPIVRAREFLPQLASRRDPRRVDAGLAFWLIAAGLVKKVVVASYLSVAADALFASPEMHGGFDALVGVYAYALQIYADFSGYTDMAIGLALLLGFRFPANFDAPYTATSLQDFWRRWHMTLSRWLRDYLYVPLGGSRDGRWRTYRNLLLTMLLGGLWHGAAWTFVVWGALHGGGLAVERLLDDRRSARASTANRHPAARVRAVGAGGDVEAGYEIHGAVTTPGRRVWLRRVATFHFVCLGWIFFRAASMSEAIEVLGRVVGHWGVGTPDPWVILLVGAMLATQFVPAARVEQLRAAWTRLGFLPQAMSLSAVLLTVDVLGPTGIAPFIYFQF